MTPNETPQEHHRSHRLYQVIFGLSEKYPTHPSERAECQQYEMSTMNGMA